MKEASQVQQHFEAMTGPIFRRQNQYGYFNDNTIAVQRKVAVR